MGIGLYVKGFYWEECFIQRVSSDRAYCICLKRRRKNVKNYEDDDK